MLFLNIVVFTVCCVIIYNVVFAYTNRKFFRFAWNNNGFFVPVLPFFGTIYFGLLILILKGIKVNPMSMKQLLCKIYGHPANVWFGEHYHYSTKDPSEIKVFLNHPKCYDKGMLLHLVHMIFGDSLITVPSDKWKIKRKFFQNSYKPVILKSFVPTMYEASCKLVENVGLLNAVNIHEFCFQYTFTNFFLTSAGLKEENCDVDFKQYGIIALRVQEYMDLKVFFPFIPVSSWLRFSSNGRKCAQSLKKIRTLTKQLIEQKKIQSHEVQEDAVNTDKAVPLYDLIIRNNLGKMDQEEIFSDITLFTAAATDTTGSALTFCFILLGMHSDIQEILYEEVMDHVGNNIIVYEDLPNLKYTEAVILETLRLFPPGPLFFRRAGADIDLGSKTVPEGSNVIIDVFDLQRDEKHWPLPLKFDPTRFLPENASKIKPYTFLPFSGGPRDCIGKGQAMMLMKITVANMVRNFKIVSKHKSIDEIPMASTLTLRVEGDVDCRFLPRLPQKLAQNGTK